MLRFYRNDGSTTPATAEYVELFDDGRFTGWRSIAPAVGWFEGAWPTSECEALRHAIADLGDVTPAAPPPGPLDRDPRAARARSRSSSPASRGTGPSASS